MTTNKNPFDTISANLYTAYRPKWDGNFVKEILSKHLSSGAYIFEPGAGTGLLTDILLDYPFFVWASDPSPLFINALANKKHENLKNLHYGLAEDVQFILPQKIDAIVTGNAQHWFAQDKNHSQLIENRWQKVIKNDARLIIFFLKMNEQENFVLELDQLLERHSQLYKTVKFPITDYDSFTSSSFTSYTRYNFTTEEKKFYFPINNFDFFMNWLESHSFFEKKETDSQLMKALYEFYNLNLEKGNLNIPYRIFAHIAKL